MSAAKDKGTRAETAVVDYLQAAGFYARRLPPAGARDVGDIEITGYPLVFEVKAAVSAPYGVWLAEAKRERFNAKAIAGIVIHKPKGIANPAEYRVVMTLEDFIKLI